MRVAGEGILHGDCYTGHIVMHNVINQPCGPGWYMTGNMISVVTKCNMTR